MTETSENSSSRQMSGLSIGGLAVALVALVAAVISPWVLDALQPEAKPIDEVAVDFAVRIKERLAAKIKGKEFIPPPEEKRFNWDKWYPAGTVTCGVIAICLGVVGFVRHEDIRLNGATVTVGLSAILFQYFLMLASILILILLIGFVLSALGINLPVP